MAASDGAGGSGRDWVDVVAFHSYSHDGYNNLFAIPQMVANVRAVMALRGLSDRPIWITETSAITPPLKSFVVAHQQSFIARSLLLALGSGVDRVVWYAWDDPLGFHRQPAVAAYWNEFTGLLAGATISLVNSLRNRRVAAVIDGKRISFEVPPCLRGLRSLFGAHTAFRTDRHVTLRRNTAVTAKTAVRSFLRAGNGPAARCLRRNPRHARDASDGLFRWFAVKRVPAPRGPAHFKLSSEKQA